MTNEFHPIQLGDLELSQPLPDLPLTGSYRQAQLILRLAGQPLGLLQVELPLSALALREQIWKEHSTTLRSWGFTVAQQLGSDVVIPEPLAQFRDAERDLIRDAPLFSVILCTRNRAGDVAVCLNHLLKQDYPQFEVWVVDNAPSSSATADLISGSYQDEPRIHYVLEPLVGLSRARNRGLAVARGTYVAFIDDDERPDPKWLLGALRGFRVAQDVACVTGPIVPLELDYPAQVWFEDFGGHSKGRDFKQLVFNIRDPKCQSPLFPVPPFGAGGNMAFKTDTIRQLGGFDTALGAGTLACGAEDTAAFLWVLLAKYTLVFDPGMLVRHRHYRELEGLKRQFAGYGVGLLAFYLQALRKRPSLIWPMLGIVPRALRYLRAGNQNASSTSADYPAELQSIQRRGMLMGPMAYMRSLRQAKRIDGQKKSNAATARADTVT